MKNPLIKRIPKEIVKEWPKYIVIIIFMVLMIGVVSGMYVGHDSMMEAIEKGRVELKLEDGSFELSKKASQEALDDISKGEKADVRQYFIDKGMKEADEEVAEKIEEELESQVRGGIEEMVREQCQTLGITDETLIQEQIDAAIDENYDDALDKARNSSEFKDAEEEAYKEAHDAVIEAVDEEWEDIAEQYSLNDEITPAPVTIYENFYRNESEDYDGDGTEDATVRVFKSDSEIDHAAFLKGHAPETENEIAIDRMHADNVGIKVGDTIKLGDKEFEVTGLLSYVNYLTLHEKNTDFMFDAFGFNVGMVTPEGFESLKTRIHYNYAYKYDYKPVDKVKLSNQSDDFMKALITTTLVNDLEIENYLPEYLNQATNFAPSDIDGDTTGTSILCYILIAVIAFIFAVTISNTIEKEASVIGTLRASGYTKGELVFHYMSMPVIVTFLGAIIGNIVGYTALRDMAVGLYYNSYSLPNPEPVWSPDALLKTTIVPLVLMFFVNLFVIIKKLKFSPLQFLRHDLKKKKRAKARRIPSWSFMNRFRLRIMFQNIPNYLILIFGVIFIEIMLCFAFGLPDSLNHYSENAADMLFADYQYMLMGSKDDDGELIETKEESAEKFSSTSLLYPRNSSQVFGGRGSGSNETITVYGIIDESKYISIPEDLPEGSVYISSAYKAKFKLEKGDVITLHEEYENKSYEFTVAGEVDYDGGIAIFMNNDTFNEVFDKKEGEFSGFFSNKEIKDVDEQYIAMVITQEDITKTTNQLNHSMGGFMGVFRYALIILSAALIYLLAKIIIERNENSISMAKILGFMNGEIGSLYMIPTAVTVVVFSVISFFVGYVIIDWVFDIFIGQMDGWFEYYMSVPSMILSVVYILVGYALVSIIDFIRIKKIPMDEALKNVE